MTSSAPSHTQRPDPRPDFRVSIVLVRPREEGNVGSVARAMANMGLDEMVLVEPAAEIGGVARGFGVGGWEVLDGARRVGSLEAALDDVELAVGTSSGRSRPLRGREVRTARQLARGLPAATRVALVFGPEDNGLRRDELELCDLLVTIPCAAARPTLNLAQAVLLIAYEIHLARLDPERLRPERLEPEAKPRIDRPETRVGERRQLIELARPLVAGLGFDHEHLREGIVRDLRALLRRARPDRRQLGVLRRLLERALERVVRDSPRGPEEGGSG